MWYLFIESHSENRIFVIDMRFFFFGINNRSEEWVYLVGLQAKYLWLVDSLLQSAYFRFKFLCLFFAQHEKA